MLYFLGIDVIVTKGENRTGTILATGKRVLPDPQPKTNKSFPWGWAVIIGIGLLVAAGQSSTKPASSSELSSENALATFAGSPSAPVVPEAAVADATLKLAARHAGMALGADGIAGAYIYSANCWASLDRSFSFATTERCAAFDAMVLANIRPDSIEESNWFSEASVATRYQGIITSHDVAVQDVPDRLERLRVASDVQRVNLVVPKPPVEEIDVAEGDDVSNGEAAMDSVAEGVGAANSW